MEIYFKIGSPSKIILDKSFYSLEEAEMIAKEALCQNTPICCIYKCYFDEENYSDIPYKKEEVKRLIWGVDDQMQNNKNIDTYNWDVFDERRLDKQINNIDSNIYWPEDDI